MAEPARGRTGSEMASMFFGVLVVLACVFYLVMTVVLLTDTTGAPLTGVETAMTIVFGLSSGLLGMLSFATVILLAARAPSARAGAAVCAVHTGVHHLATAIAIWVGYAQMLSMPDGGSRDLLVVPMDLLIGLGGLVIGGLPFLLGLAHSLALASFARAKPSAG